MVQCRKINSCDCHSNRFAVSAVAATVTATAVVLVLVAAAITATAIDTVIYIDRDKNRLGPQPPPPPRQGGEPGWKPGGLGFRCTNVRFLALRLFSWGSVVPP